MSFQYQLQLPHVFQGLTPFALVLTAIISATTFSLAFSEKLWSPQNLNTYQLRVAQSLRRTSWSLVLTGFVAVSLFRWKQNWQPRSKQGSITLHVHLLALTFYASVKMQLRCPCVISLYVGGILLLPVSHGPRNYIFQSVPTRAFPLLALSAITLCVLLVTIDLCAQTTDFGGVSMLPGLFLVPVLHFAATLSAMFLGAGQQRVARQVHSVCQYDILLHFFSDCFSASSVT